MCLNKSKLISTTLNSTLYKKHLKYNYSILSVSISRDARGPLFECPGCAAVPLRASLLSSILLLLQSRTQPQQLSIRPILLLVYSLRHSTLSLLLCSSLSDINAFSRCVTVAFSLLLRRSSSCCSPVASTDPNLSAPRWLSSIWERGWPRGRWPVTSRRNSPELKRRYGFYLCICCCSVNGVIEARVRGFRSSCGASPPQLHAVAHHDVGMRRGAPCFCWISLTGALWQCHGTKGSLEVEFERPVRSSTVVDVALTNGFPLFPGSGGQCYINLRLTVNTSHRLATEIDISLISSNNAFWGKASSLSCSVMQMTGGAVCLS